MTYRARRQNPKQRDGSPVSLFSFLAVLICTMGSLLLLLAVITHQARVQASQVDDKQREEFHKDLEIQGRIVKFQVEELTHARATLASELDDARLLLGGIESHIEELRRRIESLQELGRQLEDAQSKDDQQRRLVATRVAELRQKLVEAQDQLEKASSEASNLEPSYQIIPYHGPNQTRRRPIYLECRSDSIVIQPEGIVIQGSDLVSASGPGKALESALRSIREYWFQQSMTLGGASREEPYPLLLVRPSGINAYLAARMAMQGWRHDFGYELIEEDWQLTYPEPDYALAEKISRVVTEVRNRQRALAPLHASREALSSGPSYVVDPRGGLASRGGSPYESHARVSERSGNGSSGTNAHNGNALPAASTSSFAGMPHQGSTTADPFSGSTGNVLRGPNGQTEYPAGSLGSRGISEYPTAAHGPNGSAGSPSGATPGARPATNLPPYAAMPMGSGGSGSSQAGSDSPSPQAMAASSAASTGVVGQGQSSGGATCETGSPARRMADVRGQNWGLPGAVSGAIGVRRPIRVVCHADRVVILPDVGEAGAKQIMLGPRAESSIDTLISAVWNQMDTWGTAGGGMFWRPVLSMRIAPGGEARYAELQTLLDDSGLEVKRSELE